MSVKSSGSHDPVPPSGDIIRMGTFKKLKTFRKKFFVLRAETPDALARLEYYDSEKKFRAGVPPKRCITLKTCFNINQKKDAKNKHVIALYTKDDVFCVEFDTDEEMKMWLKDFLTLQRGEEMPEGEILKPKFEFVWPVTLCERSLGAGRTGLYRLCLSDQDISFVKVDEAIPSIIKIKFIQIRSSGNIKEFFYLEVGRMCDTGPGEFWCETEDSNIALNIQVAVSYRFKLATERHKLNPAGESVDIQPKGRTRSSSATESSKANSKKYNPIMSSKYVLDSTTAANSNQTPQASTTTGSTNTVSGVAMSIYNHILQRGTGKRRHSISGGGTGWSAGANHQRTQSLPVTTATATTTGTAADLTNHNVASSTKKIQGITGGGKCSFRERCDSMPTRPIRTISEGNHGPPGWGKPYLVPYRPHHLRDASHSPPVGSPLSPPSDSTGSCYSLADEHDGLHELEHQRLYSTLTPEEVIAEEDYPESPKAKQSNEDYMMMNFQTAPENNYTDMSGHYGGGHSQASNSASMSSVTSGTPSTDIRLADYPLDKVFSYVSADDDDARPCRAYSVGSKPPEAQLSSTPESARVRAFSVGSKSKKYFSRVLPVTHHHIPGVKSSSAPLLAPNSLMGSSHSSISNSNPMDDLMEMDFSCNDPNKAKNSDSRNHNGTRGKFFGFLEHLGVSFGSGDKNKNASADYVDMKLGRPQRPTSGSSDSTPYVDMTQAQRERLLLGSDNSDHLLPIAFPPLPVDLGGGNTAPYMDMSGGNVGPHAPYVDMSGPNVGAHAPYVDMSGGNVGPHAPYMDMSGGNVGPHAPYMDMSGNGATSNAEASAVPLVGHPQSPYMDMSGGPTIASRDSFMDMSGSSPVRANTRQTMRWNQASRNASNLESVRRDYMDMSQTQRTTSTSSATSKTATSPGAYGDSNPDYLDMSGRFSRRSERTNSMGSQMSTSPHENVSPKFYDNAHLPFAMQSTIRERPSPDNDGYVDMTPGAPPQLPIRHQRQNSTESTDREPADYLNMSGMNTALSSSTKTTRSDPIAIQTASGNTGVKNSSPISITSLLMGRKFSPPGVSPKMLHLPLNTYSSLPRSKLRRKSSEGGSSRDSSVSSSSTTTPYSPSAMFPMSPTSPTGDPFKTATPTTASALKVPSSVLNVPYKTGGGTKKKATGDYMMMNFETPVKSIQEPGKPEESPYVNDSPLDATEARYHAEFIDHSDDYAVMRPGVFPVKSSTLPRLKNGNTGGTSSGMTSPLASHLSSVGLNDRHSLCFMPIREKDERMCSPKPGDVPEKLGHDDKTLETANMEVEDDSRPYDRLKSPGDAASPAPKISRPNSSNSDRIKTQQVPRPASTTGSEKNPSRPSSVCSEGLASRLGSNSSVYSSSSSTSTVVAAHEPPPDDQMVCLHYASLDLTSDERRSPRDLKNASSDTSLGDGQTATFVYADIDFVRSEELNKSEGLGCASSSASTGTTVKN